MKKSNLYQREPKEEKVLTPQSRVDRFNARYSKKEQDTRAIIEDKMKKEVATSSDQPEGTKELMEAGAIHEAAVVFSHAGMEAFARMFGNSMESAVERVLKERIDSIMENNINRFSSVVEVKMVEMLEGMTAGMNEFAKTSVPQAPETYKPENLESLLQTAKEMMEEPMQEEPVEEEQEPVNGHIKEPEEVVVPLLQEIPSDRRRELVSETAKEEFEKWISDTSDIEGFVFDNTILNLEVHKEPVRLGSSKADVTIAKDYILPIFQLNAGKDIESRDLMVTLRDFYNIKISNFTIVMQKIMQQEPSIEKVRFGVYKYEEKSFRPTV